MTYRNEILATASHRLPLVSLLPPVRLSFKSIRNVLRSDQKRAARLFAESCVQSCRGWGDHLPVCWARGARLRHPRGGGEGRGRDGGRGEALGTKAREKEAEKETEREESSKALQRRGRQRHRRGGRQQPSLALAVAHAQARTRSIVTIQGYGAPS